MFTNEQVAKASAFELFIGYFFFDRQLLFDAITSRGYPNEHQEFQPVHRQPVLANMGDAVIDVLATEHLINDCGMDDAGQITLRRERMVKGTSLNELATAIIPFIAITEGERNEVLRSSIPGECLEAMVGALYLDGGLPSAKRFLAQLGFFEKI